MVCSFYFKFSFLEQAFNSLISMPRGRRRKVEVPTDSQPQFELGDTAEDIERRKRERGERDERERTEQEVWRGTERG